MNIRMAARPLDKWNLYLSPEHACHYLPARRARLAVFDPGQRPSREGYAALSARGFRRSGSFLYRPACIGCNACQSLRISTAQFTPDRSQRRTCRRNADLSVTAHVPRLTPEQYRLFVRYLRARHRGGGMDGAGREACMDFLDGGWTDTVFHEFRDRGRLLAVAVTDRFANGLSAVYTFFEPEEARRGLGVYAILWQIDAARRAGLDWLYLGYWIGGSAKMHYKNRFRPHEILTGDGWQRIA